MKRKIRTGIIASIGLILMILDTKTAITGAQEGIRLCCMTVIPSLLPYIFLSNLLTSVLAGVTCRPLRVLGRLFRMPSGSEGLFLIGALGGYPTGAQAVANCCREGALSKTDAERLLGFCSNAGPSFLFGMAAFHFESKWVPFLLWLIHLVGAALVGISLPGSSSRETQLKSVPTLTYTEALKRAVMAMAQICGWILLFRILLTILDRWFLWCLDEDIRILLTGVTELANGCSSLSGIDNTGLRFILCAGFLGFGGICVAMQTASVVGDIGFGMYLWGKSLHGLYSMILAYILQLFLLPQEQRAENGLLILVICGMLIAICLLLLQKREKRCSIPDCVGV